MFGEPVLVFYCCISAEFGDTKNSLFKCVWYSCVACMREKYQTIWEKNIRQIGLFSWLQKELFRGFTFGTVRNALTPQQNWSGSTAI